MQNVFKHIYQQANDVMGWLKPQPSASKAKKQSFAVAKEPIEETFVKDQLVLFQKRTTLFLQKSFPQFAKTLSKAELEQLATHVQKQAARRGFITENHIWFYLTATVYCGFFFEQDIQYADMLDLIGWNDNSNDKALKLDRLLDIVDQYAIECEKDYQDFDKKLQYLAEFYTSENFTNEVLEGLKIEEQILLGEELVKAIFTVRSNLWSEEARRNLVKDGLDHAKGLGFTVKDSMFYILASIYLGRAFESSPLYCWASFLQDKNIASNERGQRFIGLMQKHLSQLMARELAADKK